MRREAVVTAAVLALVAGGLVFTDQYIFGHRCGGRIERYQREPINALPPHAVKVGSRNDRPQCGIMFPSGGSAELRLASTETPESIAAWYEQNFGDTYHLFHTSKIPVPGVDTLSGIRNDGERRMAALIRIGPEDSTRVFVYGLDHPLPPGTVTIVDVEVSQL